ncbi:MAG: universal stress protein [Polyangiaceae bacterium]|jgi:nucleotide-binding universal stress UspA family protein
MMATPDLHHILVPHDFSGTAERALGYALALAERLGARITIMHAYESPSYGYPDAVVASLEFETEIARAAKSALDGVLARFAGADVDIDTLLRRGTPWIEIGAAAESLKTDLIVMGTQGRRGLARALLGSVAERVVRTASCPVLTVRAGHPEPHPIAAAERADFYAPSAER